MASAPRSAMKLDERGNVDFSQHIGVHGNKRLIANPRLLRREGNGAARIERAGLDGVRERDAGAPAFRVRRNERVRAVTERKNYPVYTVVGQLFYDSLYYGATSDREHLFGRRKREWAQSCAFSSREHHRFHRHAWGVRTSPPFVNAISQR